MSLTDLWRYLSGMVTIEASGPALERFINLSMTRGISLRDIRWRGGRIRADMALRDFFRLRPLARQSHTRVRVRRRLGWPFLWHRAKKRKVLLAGALVFLILIFTASQFVWFVEVRGTKDLNPAEVKQAAAELGLRPGVWKGSVSVDGFERSLRAHFGGASAVMLRFAGTRAVVQVVERTLPPPDRGQHDPADLVALRPGRVKAVVVYSGSAEVKEGDLVEAGQVLIRGLLIPGVGRGALEFRPEAAVPVRARGQVRAETWRDIYLEVPLTQAIRQPSGERVTRYELQWGRRDIIIPGRSVAMGSYQIDREVRTLMAGRIIRGPVEWVETTFVGIDARSVPLSSERAAQAAETGVVNSIRQGLSPGASVTGVSRDVVWQTPRALGLRLLVTVQEDIVIPRLAASPMPRLTGEPPPGEP